MCHKFVERWLQGVKVPRSDSVVTLDLRRVRPGVDSSPGVSLYSTANPATSLIGLFLKLLLRCSDLRCVVFDGHPELEPTLLAREAYKPFVGQIRLLSMADCQVALPTIFFAYPAFRKLLYLDISNNHAWAQMFTDTFTRHHLPSLRILKLKGLKTSCPVVLRMLKAFSWQLWSLDVSNNKSLQDDFLPGLVTWGFDPWRPPKSEMNEHFQVEGMLLTAPDAADDVYILEESAWSATFSHPDRYLADPPRYHAHLDGRDPGPTRRRFFSRVTGTEVIRGDSLDDTIRALDGGPFRPVPAEHEMPYEGPTGLTHLHFNDLNVHTNCVERLLLYHSGCLEHFECNRALMMYSDDTEWLEQTLGPSTNYVLYGLPGMSYLFRPVFQSNLRVLKIHHSLVTNIPTLGPFSSGDPHSTLESLWLAETHLRARLDTVFPQTYVPDMNPRLHSLTLSGIPRRSSGIVTDRLVRFLQLAAAQEQGVERTRRAITHYRGATVLRGLRHIRLEFAPDPNDLDDIIDLTAVGGSGFEGDEDVAAAMSALDRVSGDAWGTWDTSSEEAGDAAAANVTATAAIPATAPAPAPAPAPAAAPGPTPPGYEEAEQQHAPPSSSRPQQRPPPPPGPQRLTTFPYNSTDTEYYNHRLPDGDDGSPVTVPVWIGSGILRGAGEGSSSNYNSSIGDNDAQQHTTTTAAVDEYMRTLATTALAARSEPTRATPAHVAAGVPAGVLFYGRAWERMLFEPPPSLASAGGAGTEMITAETVKPPGPVELRRTMGITTGGGGGGVLEGIKAFRVASRARYEAAVAAAAAAREGSGGEGGEGPLGVAGHDYWRGKLDVEFAVAGGGL